MLLGRTEEELASVVSELGDYAAGHHHIVTDISSGIEMTTAYEAVRMIWDSLEIVVANAGVNGVWAPLDKLELSEWDETMSINLRGTFRWRK